MSISKQLIAEQIDSAMDAAEASAPPKTTFVVMAGVALFALVQGAIGEQAQAGVDAQPNQTGITSIQE